MLSKLRYQLNTIRAIAKTHNPKSDQYLDKQFSITLNSIRDTLWSYLSSDEGAALKDTVSRLPEDSIKYNVVLMIADQLISFLPETEIVQEPSQNLERIIPNSKDVFIIHGHDQTNVLKLRSILKERFGLNPIILNEQASKGRTIIEKFEQEALSTVFAFALLTPDDQIENNNFQYYQARPNVIFEIGWFYSRLGRDRVAILFKKGTKIHSDLDGIIRLEFINSVEEKLLEIERELKAADTIQ